LIAVIDIYMTGRVKWKHTLYPGKHMALKSIEHELHELIYACTAPLHSLS